MHVETNNKFGRSASAVTRITGTSSATAFELSVEAQRFGPSVLGQEPKWSTLLLVI